jgi:hypothetical protein
MVNAKWSQRKEEGSDDEFSHVAAPEPEAEKGVEVKPEDILARVRDEGLDFSKPDSDAVKAFYGEYSEPFAKQEARRVVEEPGNLLHVLAVESAPNGRFSAHWTEERLSQFLRWFLQRHCAFLETRTSSKSNFPLHTAFLNGNHAFIRAILEFDDLKNLKRVLVQKKSNRNYIQVAFLANSPLVEDIARKCTELTLPVWNGSKASGKESETPLHVVVQKVHYGSPKKSLEHRLLAKVGSKDYGPVAKLFGNWKYVQERRKSKGDSSDNKVVSPNDVADLLLDLIKDYQNAIGMFQVGIVKLFIELSESTLEHQSRETESFDDGTIVDLRVTPYQERIMQLRFVWDDLITTIQKNGIFIEQEGTSDKAFRRVVTEDPVADTIRYHCLRNFDRDKIARCLYQPGDGKSRIIMAPRPTIFNSSK